MKSILPIYDQVKSLLASDIRYRDDQNRLICRMWHDQLKREGLDAKSLSALDFMKKYLDGFFISADTLSRAWRKVQEEHPQLRGVTWNQRHSIKTEEVKRDLREIGQGIAYSGKLF